MKLFIYDEKHERVLDELELDPLTPDQADLLHAVIEFLGRNRLTDRYSRLVIANGYETVLDEEYGCGEVVFR